MRYRSLRVSSLGRWSPQLHAGFLVSGATQEPDLAEHALLLPGCHGLWRRFPDVFAYAVPLQWCAAAHPAWSYNPVSARPAGLARIRFRLAPVRSPLLRGYSLFLGVREMFQFPRCPPLLTVTTQGGWVAPFGDRGINARSRLPHAYRSNATSFIGTQRQGIHPLLLVSSLKEAQDWTMI
jgi:hypothetical protein